MCILFSLFRVVMTVTQIPFNATSTAEFVRVKTSARMFVVLLMTQGGSFHAIVMLICIPESKQKWRNVEAYCREQNWGQFSFVTASWCSCEPLGENCLCLLWLAKGKGEVAPVLA